MQHDHQVHVCSSHTPSATVLGNTSGMVWNCVAPLSLQVLVEVMSSKARAVGAAELLRESMRCAANAWALAVALDGLDDWTLAQIRPDAVQPEVLMTTVCLHRA